MKPVHQILLIVIGAAFGYAAGVYWPASHENPKSSASAAPGVASDVSVAQREQVRIVDRLIETITSPRTLADYANLDRAFDSMNSADFAEFARHLGRIPTESRKRALTLWFSQWLRCDQAAASAWMREQLDRRRHDGTFGVDWTSGERDLLEIWARSVPAAAMDFVRERWGDRLSVYALGDIINSWRQKDFPDGLRTLLQLPDDQHRRDAIRKTFTQWVQHDSAASLAAAQALPQGPDRESAIAQSLVHTAQMDPVGTLERAKSIGQTRGRLLASLISEAAVSKPEEAARWLERQDPRWLPGTAPALVAMWARKDPMAAFAWAAAHGISIAEAAPGQWPDDQPGVSWETRMRGTAGAVPLQTAWSEKPEVALAWLRSNPTGPERETLALASLRLAKNPGDLLAIYEMLSPADRADRAATIAATVHQRDPDAAQQFASKLPPGETCEQTWRTLGRSSTTPIDLPAGPDRDAMFDGLVIRHAGDLSKASGYVLEIADPVGRRRAFDHLMWQHLRETTQTGSVAARQWLESADVPAEWKQAWKD